MNRKLYPLTLSHTKWEDYWTIFVLFESFEKLQYIFDLMVSRSKESRIFRRSDNTIWNITLYKDDERQGNSPDICCDDRLALYPIPEEHLELVERFAYDAYFYIITDKQVEKLDNEILEDWIPAKIMSHLLEMIVGKSGSDFSGETIRDLESEWGRI